MHESAFLQNAVRKAGDAIRSVSRDVVHKKTDGSPVTRADELAHDILMRELSGLGMPVISEESDITVIPQGDVCIIDPLDGTSSFNKEEDGWTVMVGLIIGGEPTIGVIYSPAAGKMWCGIKGVGAWVEHEVARKEIHVSNTNEMISAKMATSIHHRGRAMNELLHRLSCLESPLHGAGTKMVGVADGTVDMYWSDGALKKWDVCAGHAIVVAAGGRVTEAMGNSIVYPGGTSVAGLAVSNGNLHDILTGYATAITH